MSNSDQALAFYLHLEAEVSANYATLDLHHYDYLCGYYESLRSKVSLYPFYRYSWMRRVSPMQKVIVDLPRRKTPWRILDAGCGLGTEAVFWSTLLDQSF